MASFVIARRDGPVGLEFIDGAFDRVALFVPLLVEAGRPAAMRTPARAGYLVILLFRDDVADAASSQVGTDGAVAVRLVRAEAVRASARAAEPGAGHANLVHDRFELSAVRPLSGGDCEGQRAAAAIGAQVDLGGEPAAGAAQTLARRTAATRRPGSLNPGLSLWRSATSAPLGQLDAGAGVLRAPAACW